MPCSDSFLARPIRLGFILFMLLLPICQVTISCSLTKVVPVQMARVHQIESYIQEFQLPDLAFLPSKKNLKDPALWEKERTKQLDHIFRTLLGQNNWQNIRDIYGVVTLYEEMKAGGIFIKGTVNLTLYIDPLHHGYFFIEGMGRYYLVREANKAILLSGDFYIPLARYSFDKLNATGRLYMGVELYVTRVPEQITYINEVHLIYELFMNRALISRGLFAVDYRKEHKVYLITDRHRNRPRPKDVIATMQLLNNYPAVKLIDLRGMKFLRDDYDDLTR